MTTEYQQLYIQRRREETDDLIEEIRRSRIAKNEKRIQILQIETAFKIAVQALTQDEIIIVRSSAINFLDKQMTKEKIINNLELYKEKIPNQKQWIEFEEELGMDDLPFTIKMIHITKIAPEIVRQMEIELPKGIEMELSNTESRWIVDVADPNGTIEFSYAYIEKRREIEREKCPFGVCEQKDKSCISCRKLRTIIVILINAINAAQNGAFQEEVIVESKPTRSEQRSTAHSHGQAQQSKEVIVKQVDIREKKVYRTAADEEDQQQEERNRRENWLSMHSQDEITYEKKKARKHTRRLKSGQIVDVKESADRKYYKLKKQHITELK